MAESFPDLGRDTAIQVHEGQTSPNRFNPEIFTKARYNQTLKNQTRRKNFESSKRKKKDSSNTREPQRERLSSDSSAETLQSHLQ